MSQTILDEVLEAGPRALPFAPASVREAIAGSSSLTWYRDAVKLMGQEQAAAMRAEIKQIGVLNRQIEKQAVKGGIGLPYAKIPLSVIEHFKLLYGEECWGDEQFLEDFLKHHPECKLIVNRNERGNEWSKYQ